MSDYNISPYSEDAMPQQIGPETAKVANTYLKQGCSLKQTANYLNLEPHEVSSIIKEPAVKSYINGVLRENGYRHMIKIAEKLDDLIERKWEELDEAEIGSNKDIAELLQMAYKFQLDITRLIQKDEEKSGPSTQTNTQVNVYGEGAYGKLMDRLING